MNKQRLFKERIRRVKILFKELGYTLFDEEQFEGIYISEIHNADDSLGGILIDSNSKFLEITYTFSFTSILYPFIKSRIEELFKICYEYGTYCNINEEKAEILFSVYTKIYYSGLNYFSLRDTLNDFRKCIIDMTELLFIDINEES